MSPRCLSANAPCAAFANTDTVCEACQSSYDAYREKAQREHHSAKLEAEIVRLNAALALIRNRAVKTNAERWIDDAAAIHSIAYSAQQDATISPKDETA